MINTNDFMTTTLARNPEYYDEVLKLIEKEFDYSDEYSFGDDFHLLINPLNFENSYLCIEIKTNRVVSHVAFCKREMIKNNITLPVILIGGIVTHHEFKGRGFFKALMNLVLEENENKCGLFILWSEITGLYEKFSFTLAGGIKETGNSHFNLSSPPSGFVKSKFNTLSNKEFNQIIELYSNSNEKIFFTIKRNPKDWSLIRELNSIDLFIKRNDEGVITEYFCVNKGKDLKNIIHEIAADGKNIAALINNLKNYKCWLPETTITDSKNELFYTAFIRIGSATLLANFLEQVTNKDLIIKSHGDKINFTFKGQAFELKAADFIQYVFGPKIADEFLEYQLSPYISGTDSI